MVEKNQIKEIETKALLTDKEKVLTKLSALGILFGEEISQHDTYFINFEGDFTLFRPRENFLRIRRKNNEIEFTIKQPQSNELDVIEHTVGIDNESSLRGIISLLGYKEIISVEKTRRQATYGEWTLCLDTVYHLGDFLEIEYIGTNDEGLVQNEQKLFLEELGILGENIILSGYDTLLYKKIHTK